MMRLLLLFALLLCASAVFAQTSDCDSIVWQTSRKLTWNDYKAAPMNEGPVAARTNYNFLQRSHVERGSILVGKMICIFSPCKSWSKDKSSPDLLKHEQGHFDIAEYFRRVYNKRILEEKYTPASIRLVLLKGYVDIQLECLRLEDQYDLETTHGLNKEKQAEWLKKIADLLDSVRDYDKEEVKLDLMAAGH